MNQEVAVRAENGHPMWSPGDLAEHLGIPLRTLYNWRYEGKGPRAYKIGRHIRYDPLEVGAWLKEQASRKGTEAG